MADFLYSPNPNTLPKFFAKMQDVGMPNTKVTAKWLSGLGFKGPNDRYVIGILKSLGFTDGLSMPTGKWQAYRNKGQARAVMAQAIREGYSLLFVTYPDAYKRENEALRDFFGTHSAVGAKTISYMVNTFKTLAELADFEAAPPAIPDQVDQAEPLTPLPTLTKQTATMAPPTNAALIPITMNIQIVIPSDASSEQYDKIFSSIKKFLTTQE